MMSDKRKIEIWGKICKEIYITLGKYNNSIQIHGLTICSDNSSIELIHKNEWS